MTSSLTPSTLLAFLLIVIGPAVSSASPSNPTLTPSSTTSIIDPSLTRRAINDDSSPSASDLAALEASSKGGSKKYTLIQRNTPDPDEDVDTSSQSSVLAIESGSIPWSLTSTQINYHTMTQTVGGSGSGAGSDLRATGSSEGMAAVAAHSALVGGAGGIPEIYRTLVGAILVFTPDSEGNKNSVQEGVDGAGTESLVGVDTGDQTVNGGEDHTSAEELDHGERKGANEELNQDHASGSGVFAVVDGSTLVQVSRPKPTDS